MPLCDASRNNCAVSTQHLVNRFGATVLSAPPTAWRDINASLPPGGLHGVRMPLVGLSDPTKALVEHGLRHAGLLN